MISKILSNVNNLINYFVIFIVLLLVTYTIYKVIVIEGEIYVINERLNRVEMECISKEDQQQLGGIMNTDDYNVANIIMNEIFTQTPSTPQPIIEKTSIKVCKKDDSPTSIDLDNIIHPQDNQDVRLNEEIFDLKKEVIADDRESIISSTVAMTKKKLQKMSVDKLKEKCIELGLSSEGTKAQMIDRIMEENNKD
jgi:hypothetical protein